MHHQLHNNCSTYIQPTTISFTYIVLLGLFIFCWCCNCFIRRISMLFLISVISLHNKLCALITVHSITSQKSAYKRSRLALKSLNNNSIFGSNNDTDHADNFLIIPRSVYLHRQICPKSLVLLCSAFLYRLRDGRRTEERGKLSNGTISKRSS